MKEKPLPCPICGGSAFCHKDAVQDMDFGYSVGCPRAAIGDKVHHLSAEELDKARLVLYGFSSRKAAIEAWNRRVRGL